MTHCALRHYAITSLLSCVITQSYYYAITSLRHDVTIRTVSPIVRQETAVELEFDASSGDVIGGDEADEARLDGRVETLDVQTVAVVVTAQRLKPHRDAKCCRVVTSLIRLVRFDGRIKFVDLFINVCVTFL